MGQLAKNVLPLVMAFVFFLAALVGGSLLFQDAAISEKLRLGLSGVVIGLGMGVLISTQVIRRLYHAVFDKVSQVHGRGVPRSSQFAFLVVAGVSACIVHWLVTSNKSAQTTILQRITHDPGGLYAVTFGYFSLLGLYISLDSLRDQRTRIRDFEQFASFLIRIAKEVAQDNSDCLRMMALTPLPGNLMLPDSRRAAVWGALQALMHKMPGQSTQLKLICLNPKDLKAYYRGFKGRATARGGHVDEAKCDKAAQEAEDLLKGVEEKDLYRREEGEIPDYYVISSKRWAVIVAPLFMPLPKHGITVQRLQGYPVVMNGFATEADVDVERARDLFDSYFPEPVSEPAVTVLGRRGRA